MSRTIWMNGAFMTEDQAQVPIFDRGLLFADAVYEGLGVLDGQIVDLPYHMARLKRSLSELKIDEPMGEAEWKAILSELIARNEVEEGFIYLHITRGVHDRDYLYPDGLKPNMFAFTQPQHGGGADEAPEALRLGTAPDIRWARRDIKTTNLLGQVLAKVAARDAGADEALMIDPEGYVTEGGAVSFFMVKDGVLYARPLRGELLPGVTRASMLRVAEELGLEIRDNRYKLEEIFDANEAFVTGASSYVQPVSHVDGQQIGDGSAGPVTLKLREAYLTAVRAGFSDT
ncbi:D-amino acid aminotransferase [Roseovarius sp. EL26]|uniref:D-amino acid aminotransferase n=1 Tax=Roseovarius sp. EL26 TaxID=2126672 RepID=UPI000EA14836|nr:D-amino acid aminotransferase [Roseovarius sp. EL26]